MNRAALSGYSLTATAACLSEPGRSLPMAGEWIHYAALAIKAQIPISVLTDTVAQFPTYTEGYLKGLEQLDLS